MFNKDGICSACEYKKIKDTQIDWKKRERELKELCNKYRSRNSSYDVINPAVVEKTVFLQVIF